eukprot:846058-Prymnesium_polylepis.1
MGDSWSERRSQAYARLHAVLLQLDEFDPPETSSNDDSAEGAALDHCVAGVGSTPETCESGVKRRR